MRPCERGPEPEVLRAGGARWTAAWIRRWTRDVGAEFRWPRVKGIALNRLLMPALEEMTSGHCAYCDGFPFGEMAPATIDHLQPKAEHPALAFQWANLFLACPCCQCPGGAPHPWDDSVLRPDAADYTFERYFLFNPASGEIEPNPVATEADRRRATATIAAFGLNLGSRPVQRKRALSRCQTLDPADRPYRFIFQD